MSQSDRRLARRLWPLAAGVALLAAAQGALAQKQPSQGGIYTCIDANGRRLTSDRPIPACLDREQRELTSSGTTRRVVPPAMTATEREAHEAEQRKQRRELELARSNARRDQALLIRYPNKEAHDAGRQDALAQSQMVVDAAQNRLNELAEERKKLDGEMEFYRKNPSQAPGKLRRAIEQNEEAMEQQRGVIAGQQGERERINASFDAEAERLKSVWQAAAEKR